MQPDNSNNQDLPSQNPSQTEQEVLLKHQKPLARSSLAPFSLNTLESPTSFAEVFYSQKHNMIIASFMNCSIKFYDASTLKPIEKRKLKKLQGYVVCTSYDEEADTFLMGCGSGNIYMYNVSKDELKKLREGEDSIRKVRFLSPKFYAFSHDESEGCLVGSIYYEKTFRPSSQENNFNCWALEVLAKKSLLLSVQEHGFTRVYRTNKLPELPKFCSFRPATCVMTTEVINIKGKEYIVTTDIDRKLKIWHLLKGKMRLLRVIDVRGYAYKVAYLESFKVIAVLCDRKNEVKFWEMFSGKLQKKFVFSKNEEIGDLFLMKDKNIIGAVGGLGGLDPTNDCIEFVQLLKDGAE